MLVVFARLWAFLALALPVTAVAVTPSTESRPIKVCEARLSHSGLIRLEPGLYRFLPMIRRFVFANEFDNAVRASIEVTAHSTDRRAFSDIVNIARFEQQHRLSVILPPVTVPSDIQVKVRHILSAGGVAEKIETFYFVPTPLGNSSPMVLQAVWTGEPVTGRPSPQRLAALFVALSMTPSADFVAVNIGGIQVAKTIASIRRLERLVERGQMTSAEALEELDIPYLSATLKALPLEPVGLGITPYVERGFHGNYLTVLFSTENMLGR